jgi:hypothetical protein
MTDEALSYIIDILNKDRTPDLIFLRPLAQNIFIGKVWVNNATGEVAKGGGYTIFFVQNRAKTFVAAVIDMGRQDLHVFVKPRHRKKGHLVKALRSVILPYLFATGRDEQRITFKTQEATHHAAVVGFRLLSDTTAVIAPADIPELPAPSPGTIPPCERQIERIKQRLETAADLLRMARDEVEATLGEDEAENLNYYAERVAEEERTISDLWQDLKASEVQSKFSGVNKGQSSKYQTN